MFDVDNFIVGREGNVDEGGVEDGCLNGGVEDID
jgi:hypothetical protein